MTQEQFNNIANQTTIPNAVWVAKYYGIAITVVRAWVAAAMNANKA